MKNRGGIQTKLTKRNRKKEQKKLQIVVRDDNRFKK